MRAAWEREAVYRLRYDVYVAEMRRPLKDVDHVQRRVTDPLDDTGELLSAFVGDEAVGTLRYHRLSDADLGAYEDLYGLRGLSPEERRTSSVVTSLMVRPAWRRTHVGRDLFVGIYDHGARAGVTRCWIDCNPPVVPMFLSYGFVQERTIDHPVFGQVALMVLDLTDLAHLEAVGSPFVPLARTHFGAALHHPTSDAIPASDAHPTIHDPGDAMTSTPSTLDTIKQTFDEIVVRFHAVPAVQRLLSGQATVREYASLLRSIAFHTRENPQIQACATVYFRGDQRRHVRGFLRHAISEIDHDALAVADLRALGFDPSRLALEQPSPAPLALNAFAYYQIQHGDPVGYLGYLFFLEFLPTSFGAAYMAALDTMGVPREARTFLMDHATVDVGHNKLMEGYLRELVVTEADLETVRHAMAVTARLYGHMISDAFDDADVFDAAWPLAPAEVARTRAA